MTVRRHDVGEVQRAVAHHLQVGAGQAVLDRAPDGRPEVERVDEDVDADEVRLGEAAQLRLHALAGGEVARLEHDLAEEAVGELLVERQVEAHCPLPHVGAPGADVGVPRERRLEAVHLGPRFRDRAVLRQRHVDEEVGAVG